ncbi:MAG: transposase [Planctomycetes bacterium]|nr:transposase [Planctomycetota bacterium]
MVRKRTLDEFGGASFVTSSCYKRRRWLEHDQGKRILLGILAQELRLRDGLCIGFVVMPDHVHGLSWFQEPRRLSAFMQMWKRRSSVALKHLGTEKVVSWVREFPASDAVWQKRFYEFNVYSERKVYEKLEYMHYNPVRAGLVREPCAWPRSSARFWGLGKSVGVPVRMPS